ncbi:MAG: hypothetical protein ACXWKC_01830 [Xanthobacteraceae bacterium]
MGLRHIPLIIAICATTLFSEARAQTSNVYPLAFGMTPQQVAEALRSSLVYVRGRPGSEVFVAQYDAGVPGFYPVDERIWLQFRRGHLTGWKSHWRVRKGWL